MTSPQHPGQERPGQGRPAPGPQQPLPPQAMPTPGQQQPYRGQQSPPGQHGYYGGQALPPPQSGGFPQPPMMPQYVPAPHCSGHGPFPTRFAVGKPTIEPTTAIACAAAGLAALGGLAGLGGIGGGVVIALEVTGQVWPIVLAIATGVLSLSVAALLLPGSILLFLKRAAGRWMILVGSLLLALAGIAGGVALVIIAVQGRLDDEDLAWAATGSGLAFVFAVTMFVLVLLKATARWCASRDATP